MRLRRSSWLARGYFLMAPDRTKPVSVCQLMAGVFIGLPVLGVFMAVIFVIAGPFMLAEEIAARWRRRRGDRSAPSRPSALTEWLRAKKRHVCPLVEFDD